MPSLPRAPWIQPPPDRPGTVLFCLPYAGGGSADFRAWAPHLPSDLHVVPVLPPGREVFMGMPALRRMPDLVEALLPYIAACSHRPYAFFGHSLGAVVSFELCRALLAAGYPAPRRLMISARRAPQVASRIPPFYHLPEDAFLVELERRYGALPEVLRQNRELLSYFLPTLRADLELNEHYQPTAGPPLDVPVSAFVGTDDPIATPADMAPWAEHTRREFTLSPIAGGHFFLRGPNRALLDQISAALRG